MANLNKVDTHCTVQTIRGVRYITNSFYSGDKDIFQKMEEIIAHAYESSDLHEFDDETLVDDDIALDDTV